MIVKSIFGRLDNGNDVRMYTLTNKLGAEVKIIDFGATVVSLTAPDRDNHYADVVLGYDCLEGYINDSSYFGSIVGRNANRISKAEFYLNGIKYKVSANEGENQLHGGKVGFNKVIWKSEAYETKNGPAVKLICFSPDGDQGYPGNLMLTVVYTLSDDNELIIDYNGITDKPTVLNASNHTYFNLSGMFTNTILNHLLKINSKFYTPINKELIPTSEIAQTDNTPLDFSKPIPIGARINDNFEQLKIANGYDFNWILDNYNGVVQEAADLYEPVTGRYLQVYTDQPGIQFYSGNFLDGKQTGKNQVKYNFRTGLALETQHYPNSPNEPKWPSVILNPGQEYVQITIYKFSAK